MRAKKSLGQNFLRDNTVIERIVSTLSLTAQDTVIEIGPGEGALTFGLIRSTASVTVVEFDRDLIDPLRRLFNESSNFSLVHADALNVDFRQLAGGDGNAKLVANLPYNISTPILQRLIEQREAFSTIVLMFQREVADRISAKPGNSSRGVLSVLTENAFDIERLFDVHPAAFWPVPKVWSSVIRLIPRMPVIQDAVALRRILNASFAQKRKTILNNLKHLDARANDLLKSADIDCRRRAETLTLVEWERLVTAFIPDQ
ncbi:MAG: 16S rRNA (adenine(1518)-N(6)/adenine(1519)-N(6))-dimethyltransferase RsmA [Pyrinomonadaceae bacterium]